MNELLEMCRTLLWHCEEHNKDYHHRTPSETIDQAKRLIQQQEEWERRQGTYEQLHE